MNGGISDQRAVVIHFAVDQVVVGEWWRLTDSHYLLNNLEVLSVVCIAEHDWSKVIVVLNLRGTVNDHRSNQATSILSAVVRMIP